MPFIFQVFQQGYKSLSVVLVTLLLGTASLPGAGEWLPGFGTNSRMIKPMSSWLADSSNIPPTRGKAEIARLDLYANIETIGVVVSGVDLPETAELLVRKSGDVNWLAGHPLVRIDTGNLVGSLFGLSAETSYEVKVLAGANEISATTTTQPDELQFTPSAILHVNASGQADGDGSFTAPFQTIQEAVKHANPGTQVLVADGIYHETISFTTSGLENSWIQVKAEGNGAVLDGSQTLSGDIWKPHDKERVWFTKINAPITYLARDQKRYYMYDDLSGLLNARGHNKVTMKEGWYLERSTMKLYIRSLDDPARHTWQVPLLSHAFEVVNHDWIWIEGFEIQFFGAQNSGCGVCTTNASHLVIRKNRIHNLQLGIFTNWNGDEEQGNDTHIEYNEIYDPTATPWPWSAVKGSSMEGTAIVLRGHTGAIVRGNVLHDFFNGIYAGSSGDPENSALAFDVDIYNNRIHHIADDAFEPEGACINQRFRNNIVDASFVGVSLAPVTQGPVWVLRSSFSNYSGRGIKWDKYSDGIVLIYHNTFWTSARSVNAMDLISPTYNAKMRNNILQAGGYAVYAVPAGSTGHDWNYDNWYTPFSPPFKWENKDYASITALCASTGLECNGLDGPPGLADPAGGDFTLLSSSPNIDRGILIPGINDRYAGGGPDIGAYEYTSDTDLSPIVSSISRADPNPTSASEVNFTVRFSESVTGVDLLPPFDDFALTTGPDIIGASIIKVSPVSGETYMVNVSTGTGNGTIRLDVVDDNSIFDAANNPLGGPGPGNGNFTSGEVYSVSKIFESRVTVIFKSNGKNDGWVLESSENSNRGGFTNAKATTLVLGDDKQDRQYRAILDFPTDSLPDNAVITKAMLMVKGEGVAGTNPFITHQNILVDIRSGVFGNIGPFAYRGLQAMDFQSIASRDAVGMIMNNPYFGWFWTWLDSSAYQYINVYGITQLRLRFQLDDNDDRGNDFIRFYSGDYGNLADRPQLLIEYYQR